jgi:membrane protease YdiL (CAAX protease family)
VSLHFDARELPAQDLPNFESSPEASRIKVQAATSVGFGALSCGALLAMYGSSKAGSLSSAPINSNWRYRDTLKMCAVGSLGCETAAWVLEKFGVRVGNSGTEEIKNMIESRPNLAAVLVVGVTPVFEEAINRLLPSAIADRVMPSKRNSNRWPLGIASSLVFAAMHGFENNSGRKINPAPLAVAGLSAWYIQRQGGYKHAVIDHALNNAFFIYVYMTGHRSPNFESK